MPGNLNTNTQRPSEYCERASQSERAPQNPTFMHPCQVRPKSPTRA